MLKNCDHTLTLVNEGGGGQRGEQLSSSVCKLDFVRFGPVKKPRALYLSWINPGGPTKFEDAFSQITIFDDFLQNYWFFKQLSENDLKS